MASILVLLFIFSRLMYIGYNGDNDIEGSFAGFRWLSSFLYSFGVELGFLFVAILMDYMSFYVISEVKNYFRIVSHIIATVAMYFMAWIFIDESIFNERVEMALSLLIGLTCSTVLFFINGIIMNYIESLRFKIRNLVDVIILEAPEHVKDIKIWDAEIVEPTLDMLNEER